MSLHSRLELYIYLLSLPRRFFYQLTQLQPHPTARTSAIMAPPTPLQNNQNENTHHHRDLEASPRNDGGVHVLSYPRDYTHLEAIRIPGPGIYIPGPHDHNVARSFHSDRRRRLQRGRELAVARERYATLHGINCDSIRRDEVEFQARLGFPSQDRIQLAQRVWVQA